MTSMPQDVLRTSTGEPLQPVRLYYDVPSKVHVAQRLKRLRCIASERTFWAWLYQDEAAALTFGKPFADVARELHPVLIGRFRASSSRRLVLEVRSVPRAIEAARFFGPLLGTQVVLRRMRAINRFFAAEELAKGLPALDKTLDQNVVVIDPMVTEREIQAALASARTQAEKIDAYARYHESRRHKDIPLVEDFPLTPEEETPDFRSLDLTLKLRMLRALDHWRGGHRTLREIIEEHARAACPGGQAGGDLRTELRALVGLGAQP
jgi:hypothetical protein